MTHSTQYFKENLIRGRFKIVFMNDGTSHFEINNITILTMLLWQINLTAYLTVYIEHNHMG